MSESEYLRVQSSGLFLKSILNWRRKWQPTPVYLPGKSHGQRSLMSFNPWGRKESGTTATNTYLLPYLPNVSKINTDPSHTSNIEERAHFLTYSMRSVWF